MVHHLEDKDFYTRGMPFRSVLFRRALLTAARPGCHDGATFVLALALLCMCVALNIINYTQIWFVFMPSLHLLLAIVNMIVRRA